MVNYEIKVKVEVKQVSDMIGCMFWFNNPLNNKQALTSIYREDDESTMEFIKRVKEYINSKFFIDDLKSEMKDNYREHNKEKEIENDYEAIKKELNGMTFTVNVKMDK